MAASDVRLARVALAGATDKVRFPKATFDSDGIQAIVRLRSAVRDDRDVLYSFERRSEVERFFGRTYQWHIVNIVEVAHNPNAPGATFVMTRHQFSNHVLAQMRLEWNITVLPPED